MNECAVNGTIAVRMVFTEYIADDTRRLSVRLVRRYAQFGHGIQYAAVYGLQTVAHIRQRARYDNRHRIGYKRFFQLILNIQRKQGADILFISQF